MKCPIIFAAQLIAIGKVEITGGECLKEQCAWWIIQGNVCAITSLACNFQNVYPTLQEIRDKMPSEKHT